MWSPQSCLFPRVVVPCLASPCHACPTTKRSFFSRCHHSPDDVMWWRSATRHVLVATGTSATQIMSPIRFRHRATSGGEQPAHATHATNLSERFPPGHKQNYKNRNAHCTTTRRRKLLRRLCKATFAVTASTRPEHAFLARQNPRLHGVSKCNGAGVSHIVFMEIELRQGGVRLAMLRTSDHTSCHPTSRSCNE